jgi:hypothetical protein
MKNKNLKSIDEIIFYIWHQKLKIIYFIIAFISLSLIYISQNDHYTIRSSSKFKQLQPNDTLIYDIYNRYVDFLRTEENKSIHAIKLKQLYFNKITDIKLKRMFYESIKDKKIIKQAIENSGILNKENFDNDQNYNNQLNLISSSTEIINEKRSVIITTDFKGEVLNNFLSSIQKIANENIRSNLEKEITTQIENNIKITNYSLDNLKKKEKDLFIIDKINKNFILNYLNEQALIARTLEIDIDRNFNYFKSDQRIENIGYDKLKMYLSSYYLKGYLAIEKEIEIINNRNDKEMTSNINQLLEVKNQILSTNYNFEQIKIIKKLIEETPIYKSKNYFKATEFSAANDTEYVKLLLYSPPKMVAISIFLGFLVGIIFVILESMIKKHNKN